MVIIPDYGVKQHFKFILHNTTVPLKSEKVL